MTSDAQLANSGLDVSHAFSVADVVQLLFCVADIDDRFYFFCDQQPIWELVVCEVEVFRQLETNLCFLN